jgi:poly(A) polymerase
MWWFWNPGWVMGLPGLLIDPGFCFSGNSVLCITAMEQELTPRITPRAEHPISRSLINPNALRILYRLKDSGHIAHLVGGCVRDLLLGREPKDFDVVTDATPLQIKKLFRNCRLVGRRFRLAHLHFKDQIIEVATFRACAPVDPLEELQPPAPAVTGAGKYPRHQRHLVSEEGVVLRDNIFGTPGEDALRRDYTINALAYNIADFSIIDYVGGVEDLERGVIRTIGDPGVRFTEDPVRMLRAVRFAALLGFTIEEATWRALVENAPAIILATAPRLYEEILKLFLSGEGEKAYQLMRTGGLFAPLFPGFSTWLDRESDGFPHIRISRNLEWIDQLNGMGKVVSPPLLFALMFGEYLEEWAANLREEGVAPQEAVNAAVAGFLDEQNPLVVIPHRIGLAVREILALQNRFRRIPGKRPESILARPGFCDALAYLRSRCKATGEGGKVLAWWELYSKENAMPPVEKETEAGGAGRPRRQRRRRKRKIL